MKIDIVAREIIKPHSPISKAFNFSIMDQLLGTIYTKVCFFYQNTSTDDIEEVIAKRTRCLKSSLSKVLNVFYPMAGKVRDRITVILEENDGAEFLEARVDTNLSDYLENPILEMFEHLIPKGFLVTCMHPLLIVQANFFKCGGLAIGLNISHKVADACTLTLFLNAWASTSFGRCDNVIDSDFSASLAYPAIKELSTSGEFFGENFVVNDKTQRFVFTAPQIVSLQEKATTETMQKITRIEAVTAFMWRIGLKTSIKIGGGSPVTSVLVTPVNLRKWLQPPIREHTFGNLVELQITQNDSGNIELPYLLSLLREKIKQSREAHSKNLDGKQFTERCLRINEKMRELFDKTNEKIVFSIPSWSRFPLYDTDFGWGKPTWVTTHGVVPHVMYLMDTRNGTGIEAWVNFPEEEMAIFASDEELLAYASPNPSAL